LKRKQNRIFDMKKQPRLPRIKIAHEQIGSHPGHCGGCPGLAFDYAYIVRDVEAYNTSFENCDPIRDPATITTVVRTPQEAREVAVKLAEKIGGRIHLGHLPHAWHAALADFPRS
jgi:hypothetical protein